MSRASAATPIASTPVTPDWATCTTAQFDLWVAACKAAAEASGHVNFNGVSNLLSTLVAAGNDALFTALYKRCRLGEIGKDAKVSRLFEKAFIPVTSASSESIPPDSAFLALMQLAQNHGHSRCYIAIYNVMGEFPYPDMRSLQETLENVIFVQPADKARQFLSTLSDVEYPIETARKKLSDLVGSTKTLGPITQDNAKRIEAIVCRYPQLLGDDRLFVEAADGVLPLSWMTFAAYYDCTHLMKNLLSESHALSNPEHPAHSYAGKPLLDYVLENMTDTELVSRFFKTVDSILAKIDVLLEKQPTLLAEYMQTLADSDEEGALGAFETEFEKATGTTPLIKAASVGSDKAVEHLLNFYRAQGIAKPLTDARIACDKQGKSALWVAAANSARTPEFTQMFQRCKEEWGEKAFNDRMDYYEDYFGRRYSVGINHNYASDEEILAVWNQVLGQGVSQYLTKYFLQCDVGHDYMLRLTCHRIGRGVNMRGDAAAARNKLLIDCAQQAHVSWVRELMREGSFDADALNKAVLAAARAGKCDVIEYFLSRKDIDNSVFEAALTVANAEKNHQVELALLTKRDLDAECALAQTVIDKYNAWEASGLFKGDAPYAKSSVALHAARLALKIAENSLYPDSERSRCLAGIRAASDGLISGRMKKIQAIDMLTPTNQARLQANPALIINQHDQNQRKRGGVFVTKTAKAPEGSYEPDKIDLLTAFYALRDGDNRTIAEHVAESNNASFLTPVSYLLFSSRYSATQFKCLNALAQEDKNAAMKMVPHFLPRYNLAPNVVAPAPLKESGAAEAVESDATASTGVLGCAGGAGTADVPSAPLSSAPPAVDTKEVMVAVDATTRDAETEVERLKAALTQMAAERDAFKAERDAAKADLATAEEQNASLLTMVQTVAQNQAAQKQAAADAVRASMQAEIDVANARAEAATKEAEAMRATAMDADERRLALIDATAASAEAADTGERSAVIAAMVDGVGLAAPVSALQAASPGGEHPPAGASPLAVGS